MIDETIIAFEFHGVIGKREKNGEFTINRGTADAFKMASMFDKVKFILITPDKREDLDQILRILKREGIRVDAVNENIIAVPGLEYPMVLADYYVFENSVSPHSFVINMARNRDKFLKLGED